MGLARWADADAATRRGAASTTCRRFGNVVSLLHITDCHAQLCRSTSASRASTSASASMQGQPPHLVGEHLLQALPASAPGTREAHAFTYLDFETRGAALRQGRRLRAPGDAGQAAEGQPRPARCCSTAATPGRARRRRCGPTARTWSTRCKLLGVDVMTGHWEFTLGMERVKEIVEKDFAGKIEFLAQNVKTADFGDPVFKPYVMREINGVPVAIIGQAFPYTPIANPRYFVADWTFGIQDENMQKVVDEARAKGAQVVVLLSPQRHGRRPEDGQPRRAASTRSSAATRTTACRSPMPVEQRRRQDAGHQRRQQRQVPRRARPRRARTARSRTSATGCCRCSPTCCRPTPRWTR